MNEILIRNINKVVGKKDTLIIAGDFAKGNVNYWRNKINGQVVLLKGNHDRVGHARIFSGGNILMIHDPRNAPKDWRGWLIHGHRHNETPFIDHKNKRINISVENTNYRPMSLSRIRVLIR